MSVILETWRYVSKRGPGHSKLWWFPQWLYNYKTTHQHCQCLPYLGSHEVYFMSRSWRLMNMFPSSRMSMTGWWWMGRTKAMRPCMGQPPSDWVSRESFNRPVHCINCGNDKGIWSDICQNYDRLSDDRHGVSITIALELPQSCSRPFVRWVGCLSSSFFFLLKEWILENCIIPMIDYWGVI